MLLCIGSTPAVQRTMVFDQFRLDEVNRARSTTDSAAGKAVNVARVARTLGAQVLCIGFVGGDRGDFLLHELSREGIPHDFVRTRPRTRECVTIVNRQDNSSTELVEETPAVEPQAWNEIQRKIEARLPQASMMILSGTVAPGGPPDFYARCTHLAADRSIPVIVDASKDQLLRALEENPLIAKPNRSELAATLDTGESPSEILTAMKSLIDRGARSAVITMGSAGAWVLENNQLWQVTAPRVTPINTIGSGDAFTAGLAVSLLRGEPLVQACRLASACGAANTLTPLAGHVEPKDIDRLMNDVQITPMSK